LKSILLSLDLLFALLIFSAVIVYSSLNFEYENKPSLYYYDASNALDFLESELVLKNNALINNSIYNYLGYKEYYFEFKYYNSTGLMQTISSGNIRHNSNYCSQKYYLLNSELIEAKLCIVRDYQ
jgi:hypothetical protein